MYISMAAWVAFSIELPYSGSSLPSMVLLHSNSLWRSDFGTPIISRITCSGSSAARSTTKSASPRGPIVSINSVAISRMCSSSLMTRLGVNPWFTSRRIESWRGGSIDVIISSAPPTASSIVNPLSDENVFQSLPAATTSS